MWEQKLKQQFKHLKYFLCKAMLSPTFCNRRNQPLIFVNEKTEVLKQSVSIQNQWAKISAQASMLVICQPFNTAKLYKQFFENIIRRIFLKKWKNFFFNSVMYIFSNSRSWKSLSPDKISVFWGSEANTI